MWPIHKVEYYSAVKRNEAPTHTTPWRNCKTVTLSERGEHVGLQLMGFHLYDASRTGKCADVGNRSGLAGVAWGRGVTADGDGVSLGED